MHMTMVRLGALALAAGIGAAIGPLGLLGARVNAQQPASARPAVSQGLRPSTQADGLLQSDLSLMTRTASIAVTPGLKAGGPEHQSIASAGTGSASAAGRVRIGQLRTNGALQFGTVGVGRLSQTAVTFDLSLLRSGDSWQLEAVEVPEATMPGPSASASGQAPVSALAGAGPPGSPAALAAPAAPPSPLTIPLTRHKSAASSAMLVASWSPRSRDAAGLALTWGDLRLEADGQFAEPKLPRPNPNRQVDPVNRKHDEPNAGARLLMLTQLNESAMGLPNGQRFSVTCARTFPRGQRSISAAGTIGRPGPDVEGPDFARLMSTSDGAVVELTESPVPRLVVDAPLRFGKLVVRAGNQTPGHPGAYGLWLKRVGSAWRLLFNSESDVWGTQRDPKFDVGEVNLAYTSGGDAKRPFGIALVPTAADRGRLVLAWGPHDWSAEFTTAP